MVEALNTSELGSRGYWDDAYAREIRNHAEDAEDEGTIWFDDTGAEDKVIELLEDLADNGNLIKSSSDGIVTRFLDLGTGNGHMIFTLHEEGWEGELVGVDYSETSVQLARQIAVQRQADSEDETNLKLVQFRRWDLLNEAPGAWLEGGFDVVLDKGTFDAISLSSEVDESGRRAHEGYRASILPLIKPGGLFIITSCNWTREEVLKWFTEPDQELSLFKEVKYPSFTFGGQKGQSVCSLAFKRSAD
ncbi:Protein-lysine N-methyltransferase EFM4-like protein [Elsinoe fawcettii]|nr:Protein-lysine N-methyltransferase EFM4-like protein [Elsinoe fawcettii]